MNQNLLLCIFHYHFPLQCVIQNYPFAFVQKRVETNANVYKGLVCLLLIILTFWIVFVVETEEEDRIMSLRSLLEVE
jgi:hypothetical protein